MKILIKMLTKKIRSNKIKMVINIMIMVNKKSDNGISKWKDNENDKDHDKCKENDIFEDSGKENYTHAG
jgi:hypothetical protein